MRLNTLKPGGKVRQEGKARRPWHRFRSGETCGPRHKGQRGMPVASTGRFRRRSDAAAARLPKVELPVADRALIPAGAPAQTNGIDAGRDIHALKAAGVVAQAGSLCEVVAGRWS